MKSYLDTHLRVVHMVLIASENVQFLDPFFSTSGHYRPKFDQPRMKDIWKKWNYLALFNPIWHYLALFNPICIILGLILVNPEWRWFFKIQILHFQRWNHICICIWELYTWSRLREKPCNSWAVFFSTLGQSRPKFDQPRTKAIWKKWKYGFQNIK